MRYGNSGNEASWSEYCLNRREIEDEIFPARQDLTCFYVVSPPSALSHVGWRDEKLYVPFTLLSFDPSDFRARS
jgi:hypothetical protein